MAQGGSFQGYPTLKLILNWIFQMVFAVLYGKRLTDMTYAYRIYPTKLVQSIRWEELRHPFLFEALVKPLRLGVEVIEIPLVWKARTEGESQNTFFATSSIFVRGSRPGFPASDRSLKQGPRRDDESHRYHHDQSAYRGDREVPVDARLEFGRHRR